MVETIGQERPSAGAGQNRAVGNQPQYDAGEPLVVSLTRHWRLILLVFLCAWTVFTWRLRPGPPQYVATVRMLLPQTNITGEANVPSVGLDSLPAGLPLKNVNTHLALLTGPGAIKRAADKLSPALLTSGWEQRAALSSAVTAHSPDAQSMVEVAVRANNSESATAMAQALIAVYAERLADLRQAERQRAQRLAREQIRQVRTLLKTNVLNASSKGGQSTGGAHTDNSNEIADLRAQALRDVDLKLNIQAQALSAVKPAAADFTPVLLDSTTMLDPTARTWARALLASTVCALLLALLSAIWVEYWGEQRRKR